MGRLGCRTLGFAIDVVILLRLAPCCVGPPFHSVGNPSIYRRNPGVDNGFGRSSGGCRTRERTQVAAGRVLEHAQAELGQHAQQVVEDVPKVASSGAQARRPRASGPGARARGDPDNNDIYLYRTSI